MINPLLVNPLVLALQLGLLYVLGSYALSSLGSAGAAAGAPRSGRLVFYLLVAPGVILHESAHYLACKLTGTPVGRFVPFRPRTDASGATTLGYVEHAARGPLTASLIGLAPVVVNPAVLVILTMFMTPVEPLAAPSGGFGVDSGSTGSGFVQIARGIGEQSSSFASQSPMLAAVWIYLCLSVALGSVPSRADLVAVPGALVLVGAGGFIYSSVAGSGFLWSLSSVAAHVSALYLFPLIVATVAAGAGVILSRL